MIKLFDGWAIDADEYNFILGKPKTEVIREKNKPERETVTMDNATYYSSVLNALRGLTRIKHREVIANNSMTLEDALREFERINKQLEDFLTEAGVVP